MALFLLCPNLGWIQGQFNFTELSLRYLGFPLEDVIESIIRTIGLDFLLLNQLLIGKKLA